MKKTRLLMVVILVLALLVPVNSFGASRPYKDVTKDKVGDDALEAIIYVKQHWGYIDLVNNGAKFKPFKKMTRREFCVMLGNFYGDDKIPISMRGDVRKGNKIATERYVCHKMAKLARKLGAKDYKWNPSTNRKLTRAFASQYLYVFATQDGYPKFRPHQ